MAIRNEKDELGILLFVDEVLTSFARTGRMFCSEWVAARALEIIEEAIDETEKELCL